MAINNTAINIPALAIQNVTGLRFERTQQDCIWKVSRENMTDPG